MRAHVVQLRFQTSTATLRGTEMIVGRSLYSSIIVNDGTVSRVHAAISHQDGRLEVRDFGSKNGTFVNEVRVGATPVQFALGDTLRFGDVRCLVEAASDAGGPSNTTDRPAQPDDPPDTTRTFVARIPHDQDTD